MISDRSDNTGFKSSLVKLPLDPSKNSLLSSEQGKKAGDKKTNDSINESNINQIDLNYFYDTNKPSNKSHKLIVESFDEKDHLKPYSLFRFALKNEYFEEGEHGFGLFAKYNVINEDTEVRIFNVFTNKVLYAEKLLKKALKKNNGNG